MLVIIDMVRIQGSCGEAWQALDRELRDHGSDSRPGMMVEVDTDYQPDAVVNCGPPTPDDAIAAPNPVIVVEALSPGTRGVDTGAKLDGYFRVPSIIHYLIVLRVKRGVIHHRRAPEGISTPALSRAGGSHWTRPASSLTVTRSTDAEAG